MSTLTIRRFASIPGLSRRPQWTDRVSSITKSERETLVDFHSTQPQHIDAEPEMNAPTSTAPLHVVSDDDVPPMPEGVEPTIKLNGKQPHRFAVDRGEGLEPMIGGTDLEEVRKTIKKQVVSAGINIVYIYALVGAEVYTPTSVSLDIDQVEEQLKGA